MSKAEKNMKPVIVTVDDESLNDIDSVARQLKKTGMKVNHVLSSTGVITGICSSAKMNDLQKIKGVLSVEEEVTSNLPPGDSTLQ
jgi:hypothetical protein